MQPTCNHPFEPGLFATINTSTFSRVFNPLKAAALPPAFVPATHAIALDRVVRETAI